MAFGRRKSLPEALRDYVRAVLRPGRNRDPFLQADFSVCLRDSLSFALQGWASQQETQAAFT